MIEYQVVPHPQVFPSQCICGSQTGPTLDTFIEKAGLRIYVCKLCAQRIAAAFGFAKGEELDRLMDARGELERMERENSAQIVRADNLLAAGREMEAKIAELVEERDFALGEAAQLKHIARAIEAQSHELVGGPREAA